MTTKQHANNLSIKTNQYFFLSLSFFHNCRTTPKYTKSNNKSKNCFLFVKKNEVKKRNGIKNKQIKLKFDEINNSRNKANNIRQNNQKSQKKKLNTTIKQIKERFISKHTRSDVMIHINMSVYLKIANKSN